MMNNRIDKEFLHLLTNAATHYAFRNGPVENMHADGKLSDEDMKTLNKYMMDRLAFVFKMIMECDYENINYFIRYHSMFGQNWDKAVPDGSDMEAMKKLVDTLQA